MQGSADRRGYSDHAAGEPGVNKRRNDGPTERGPDDRDAGNAARLRQAKQDILERAGGTYGTEEVAELLGVVADEVMGRLREGRLLAVADQSGHPRFPRAQFTDDGVLPGIEQVLAAMNVDAAWMRLQLFMDDDVVGALRDGCTNDAVLAVSSYLPDERRRG